MNERCPWCGDDPLYQHYHDHEWGVPEYDDRALFECLNLEGAQAGLSWITVLRKREHYRKVFDGFDAEKIVRYDDRKVAALLQDAVARRRSQVVPGGDHMGIAGNQWPVGWYTSRHGAPPSFR